MIHEFHKEGLSEVEKKVYSAILSSAESLRKLFPVPSISLGEASKAYNAVSLDHPELFYLSEEFRLEGIRRLTGKGDSIRIGFIYNPRETNRINSSLDTTINSIIIKNNRYDTIESFLTWIIRNCEYEIDNKFNQNSASLLYFKKAQCTGFAKAMKMVLDRSNIPSIVVEGEILNESGRWSPHAWNMVSLGSTYYHIDPTSIQYSNQDGKLSSLPWLLWSDFQMEMTHRWDRNRYPKCPYIFVRKKNKGVLFPTDIPIFSSIEKMASFIEEGFKDGKRELLFSYAKGNSIEEKAKYVHEGVKTFLNHCKKGVRTSSEYYGNCFRLSLTPIGR